jgi:hypothetical protein
MPRTLKLLPLAGAALALVALAMGCADVREPEPAESVEVIGFDGQAHRTGGPPPEIACDEATHDFGTVAQGEDAVHVFTIQNKGKGVLDIERARGG